MYLFYAIWGYICRQIEDYFVDRNKLTWRPSTATTSATASSSSGRWPFRRRRMSRCRSRKNVPRKRGTLVARMPIHQNHGHSPQLVQHYFQHFWRLLERFNISMKAKVVKLCMTFKDDFFFMSIIRHKLGRVNTKAEIALSF